MQWEYTTAQTEPKQQANPDDVLKLMNEAGEEGWEAMGPPALVHVLDWRGVQSTSQDPMKAEYYRAWLKRPVFNEEDFVSKDVIAALVGNTK